MSDINKQLEALDKQMSERIAKNTAAFKKIIARDTVEIEVLTDENKTLKQKYDKVYKELQITQGKLLGVTERLNQEISKKK